MDTHFTPETDIYWQGWHPGEYQAHFIHTGVAESIFHIFPDGTTMLLDCGDHGAVTRLEKSVPIMPGPQRLAGDWVARYVKRVMPKNAPMLNGLPLIDTMMLSHFHDDHSGTPSWQCINRERVRIANCYRSGFGLAIEQLAFRKAIDRGWPNYDDPCKGGIPPLEFEHMMRLYKALAERDGLVVEKFRLGATDQLAPIHHPEAVKDFSVTNITCNGRILCKDGAIKDIYAERVKAGLGINENGMSLGFILRYGKFSLYSAGDFSDFLPGPDDSLIATEDILADELPHVCVAKINHHGHKSMPDKIVRALSPRVWVACVWDQWHTQDPVMARLSDRGNYPGPRTHFPTVYPKERIETAKDMPYLQDIAPETFGNGAHVVITVPEGGETYKITCITPQDESMRILGEYTFESR